MNRGRGAFQQPAALDASSRHGRYPYQIRSPRTRAWLLFWPGLLLWGCWVVTGTLWSAAPLLAADPSEYETALVDGRVVWLSDVLAERLGVEVVPEARQRELALLTDSGEVLPLIEDLRVRAFRKDPRLRAMHVRLLVRRYHQTSARQLLRVYEIDAQDHLQQIDYWCDVCAIVMFETGDCACCQAPNRLRRSPVEQAELQQ